MRHGNTCQHWRRLGGRQSGWSLGAAANGYTVQYLILSLRNMGVVKAKGKLGLGHRTWGSRLVSAAGISVLLEFDGCEIL